VTQKLKLENDATKSVCHLALGRDLRKVVWTGFVVNLILSGVKFTAGFIGNSQAVTADAVHSLSDCITDIAVIMGSHIWSKPADENHPYGHRRLETVVTIFIGGVLIAAGFALGGKAISTIHHSDSTVPSWPAMAAAVISVIVKEALYQWTAVSGRRLKSAALTANAWHHRLDAVSSIPVIVAVGVAMIFPSWMFIDHVGAIIVSILIIQVGFKIIWPGINEMLETGASEDTCELIEKIAAGNPGVVRVHKVRTRYVGAGLHVDMHVVVDGTISVRKGHDIADGVKNRVIREGPDILDVVIHTEPDERKPN
jgi:cation diffusion facilitator family transporter